MHTEKRPRIGVSANLTAKGSVHSNTFTRAINMACDAYAARDKVNIVWENDHASYAGGVKAAGKLQEAGVELVIGHYASAAAEGALPVYLTAGIPLLLPAATADFLTEDFSNAFRMCRSDRALARHIFQTITGGSMHSRLSIADDGSTHGKSLSKALYSLFHSTEYAINTSNDEEAVIFTGSYSSSIKFLHEYRGSGSSCSVYLTDDAVHPDIAKDAGNYGDGVFIFGYAPSTWYPSAKAITDRYSNTYGELPSTYFLETYAAMQIAFEYAGSGLYPERKMEWLSTGTWNTVLGKIRFSERESNRSQFALWEITGKRGLSALAKLTGNAGL